MCLELEKAVNVLMSRYVKSGNPSSFAAEGGTLLAEQIFVGGYLSSDLELG